MGSVDCRHYGEVIFGVGDAFYRLLPVSRGSRCREVSISVNVWNTDSDEKSWPLWRGGQCREVTGSRGLTVLKLIVIFSW